MTIIRVQPAGRDTGQKLTLHLGKRCTKPEEAKRAQPKGTLKPKPKHCDASKMVEGSNESTGAANKRTPYGKTITWITVVHSLGSVGCANRAHTSVKGGKQPRVRFFF